MTKDHLKFGFFLLVIQLCLLAMTISFHSSMNAQAERAGLTAIINNEGK